MNRTSRNSKKAPNRSQLSTNNRQSFNQRSLSSKTNTIDLKTKKDQSTRVNTNTKRKSKRSRWQLDFRSKAIGVAIAIGLVSGLAFGSATYLGYRSTNEQSETELLQSAEDESNQAPSDRFSLILLTEVIASILLLVGLVAAFLANRARQAESLRLQNQAKLASEEDDVLADREQNNSSQGINNYSSSVESGDMRQHSESSPVGAKTLVDSAEIELEIEEAELAQRLTEISLRLRQSLDTADLFKTAVKEVRRVLKSDRVIVYQFNPKDWEGIVVAESVAPNLPQLLRVKIDDPCFRDHGVKMYQKGRVKAVDNIYEASEVTPCYRKMLEQFAVKANLIAPIRQNDQLLGLLIAHHCLEPHIWRKTEISWFTKIAAQVGLALEQVSFTEKQEQEAEYTQLISEISLRLRRCQSLEELLKATVKEVRRSLKTDRVMIYGLDPVDWEGVVVAESVAFSLPRTIRVKLDDPFLQGQYLERYKKGRVLVVDNIYEEPELTERHLKALEQFAVKASLIVPIAKNNQLLGLLVAQYCLDPYVWRQAEVDFLTQVATQVGLAIDQVNLLEQQETVGLATDQIDI